MEASEYQVLTVLADAAPQWVVLRLLAARAQLSTGLTIGALRALVIYRLVEGQWADDGSGSKEYRITPLGKRVRRRRQELS